MKFAYSIILLFFLLLISSCENEGEVFNELKQTVAELNKKCPQMIDSETRLDNLVVMEPNKLIYNYSLIHLLATNVDTAQFKLALWPGILSTIKISPEMKKLRDNNTLIEYAYFDMNKNHIYTFKITPKEYH